MVKPFTGTTLIDIIFEKLKSSQIIPKENIYFSVRDEELKEIAKKHNINIFNRSEKSNISESESVAELYEWYNKLPFKYVVLISACNPLLKIETIDNFIKSYMKSDKDGAFGVIEKKTYYWDKNKKPTTDWKGLQTMNTKFVEPTYEAAHCLYASRMDIIGNGYWMDDKSPPEPELFIMDELETFDIDYEWQFNMGEILYENFS